MTETPRAFLSRIDEIADVLEEGAIHELTAIARNQISAASLRVLVIGATGSGRFALVNTLLEQPNLLPITPLMKVPLGLHLKYSEQCTLEIQHRDGLQSIRPLAELERFLVSSTSDAKKYQSMNILTDASWLRHGELQIENIEMERSVSEWQMLLTQSDYVLLLLNATALLSENERKFCRDILQPLFSFERVAVVLTRMQYVPVEEYPSVIEHAEAFFATPATSPDFFLYTGLVNAANEASDSLPIKGDAALFTMLREELLQKHQDFKRASVYHTTQSGLEMLTEALNRRLAGLNESEEMFERQLVKLNADNDWLQKRIERIKNEIQFSIQLSIQEEIFHAVDEFGEVLREQLPAEVMLMQDVWTVRRSLPDYMEHLWHEFFTYQLVDMRAKMKKEMERINALVEADVRELLGDEPLLIEEFVAAFDPTPAIMRTLLLPGRSKNQRANVATGVQLAGILFIASAPVLNLAGPIMGIGLLGIGQKIRTSGRKQIASSEKEALIAAALDSLADQKQQIKQYMTKYFKELVEMTEKDFAAFYEQAMVQVRNIIEEHLRLAKLARARKDEFMRIKDEDLKDLQEDWISFTASTIEAVDA